MGYQIYTMTDSGSTGDIMAVLGLNTLGRALRERGVKGEGARTALAVVARLLNALILTRCVRGMRDKACLPAAPWIVCRVLFMKSPRDTDLDTCPR